jgi:3-oxoadipate enol-lactonase
MRDRVDSTPMLDQVAVPTLIIHGMDDQIIPTSEAEAMHQRLKDSRLQLLPRAGHLVNLEQPEAFNAEVRTFAAER